MQHTNTNLANARLPIDFKDPADLALSKDLKATIRDAAKLVQSAQLTYDDDPRFLSEVEQATNRFTYLQREIAARRTHLVSIVRIWEDATYKAQYWADEFKRKPNNRSVRIESMRTGEHYTYARGDVSSGLSALKSAMQGCIDARETLANLQAIEAQAARKVVR